LKDRNLAKVLRKRAGSLVGGPSPTRQGGDTEIDADVQRIQRHILGRREHVSGAQSVALGSDHRLARDLPAAGHGDPQVAFFDRVRSSRVGGGVCRGPLLIVQSCAELAEAVFPACQLHAARFAHQSLNAFRTRRPRCQHRQPNHGERQFHSTHGSILQM